MRNVFSIVKAAVTARQAAEHYGLEVGRGGMARCPFHADRRPSMKVDERYYCFGCHETGSVIDLTARLFDLTPYEAALKLAADFHLDPDAPPPAPAAPAKWQLERQERELEARCIRALTREERELRTRLEALAPQSPEQGFSPEYPAVSRKLQGTMYFLDLLYAPDAETRRGAAEALRNCGELERLEKSA